jgi:2-oxoacid:acceptor oxidoreductase delta subunit (pyruvate/2-ketoisovalerate family)
MREDKVKNMALFPVTSKNSLDNKTGSWRDFRPIITEKCTGCGICVKFCPDACIELVNRQRPANLDKKALQKMPLKIAKVDYYYCKGCLICKNECPMKAVDSIREDAAQETKK